MPRTPRPSTDRRDAPAARAGDTAVAPAPPSTADGDPLRSAPPLQTPEVLEPADLLATPEVLETATVLGTAGVLETAEVLDTAQALDTAEAPAPADTPIEPDQPKLNREQRRNAKRGVVPKSDHGFPSQGRAGGAPLARNPRKSPTRRQG